MLLFIEVVGDSAAEKEVPVIDEAVFGKIATGDRDAFSSLYEKVSGAVYAYCLSVLRNRTDAEDAMQDTFVKIRGAAHLYRPMGKPMAWIFTIARNLCLMKLRTSSRTVDIPDVELMGPDSFNGITDAEDRMVMGALLRLLGDDDRQIIMLHAVTGLKHREIAGIMGLPLSTVLSKYNRGIKKLRKELEMHK